MSRVGNPKGKYESPDGSKCWEYVAIVTCAIFSFSIGTTIGWISPTIVKLLEPGSPIAFTFDDISTMVAAGAVGHLISPLFSHALVDRIGRRNTLLLSALPVIISSAMIIMASHVWVIHIARVLVGFSLGMCVCVSPMYMGEVASPNTRGLASSMIGVMINLGILFAYGLCPYLSIKSFAAILMTIALSFEIAFWFMPESPYYLAMKGNLDEAEACLEKLRGKTDVIRELETIKETIPKSEDPALKHPTKNVIQNAFKNRGNRRSIAIGFIFLIPQHFGGYFLILAYCDLIFKDAGTLVVYNHYATIAVGVSQLASSIIAGVLVDKVGRRPLILSAGVSAGIANACIGVYLVLKEYSSVRVEEYSVLFLVAVLVQVFVFNCGLLSIHMVVMSEVFSTEVKGFGMSFVGICSAVFGIVSTKLYIAIAITWGIGHSVPFLFFAGIVWLSSVLLYCLTPETKGKTFLQIQQELNR